MNKLLIALMLFSANSFAYIYDENDSLSRELQQRDIEERIRILESKTQSNDLEQFEQELHDNAGDI